MKKSILFLAILLIILNSCKKNYINDHSEECYSNSNPQTIVHNEINREYVLYIPDSYDGTTEVPLMLVFHGFGGSASEFMNGSIDGNSDMRFLAETETFWSTPRVVV